MNKRADAIAGCLLGAAVGDAVGLACEGYPRVRQRKVFGEISGPRLLFGHGMISDDTEHACLVAQALVASGGEPAAFQSTLAREMKVWFLALPTGLGLATLKACLRLCVGIAPERSGVRSAGNGPAMRAPMLGVCHGDKLTRLCELNRVSSRMTHTDPKAEYGALAVALAARHFVEQSEVDFSKYFDGVKSALVTEEDAAELLELLERMGYSLAGSETTQAFANAIGCERGVSGYINRTVPVALHACFTHPDDLRAAVLGLVHCGGDTDSTAAIAGGIIGARVGQSGVPYDWLQSLWEWPRNVAWMQRLAEQLAQVVESGNSQTPLRLPFGAVLIRNLGFLLLAFAHGLRRLLPPY